MNKQCRTFEVGGNGCTAYLMHLFFLYSFQFLHTHILSLRIFFLNISISHGGAWILLLLLFAFRSIPLPSFFFYHTRMGQCLELTSMWLKCYIKGLWVYLFPLSTISSFPLRKAVLFFLLPGPDLHFSEERQSKKCHPLIFYIYTHIKCVCLHSRSPCAPGFLSAYPLLPTVLPLPPPAVTTNHPSLDSTSLP